MTKTEALAEMHRLRLIREEAQGEAAAALDEMRTVWVMARDAGVSIEEIIRWSGVARQTVYDALPTSR